MTKQIEIKINKEELKKKLDIPTLDTPDEIVNKLETLEGNDRLDISAIKGLDDYESVRNLAKKPTHFYGNSGVREIVAGSGVTVDNSSPQYPIVSATGTAVSQYAEPVIGASNDTVIYEDNSNPVPDFLFDVDGSFIMELVTI